MYYNNCYNLFLYLKIHFLYAYSSKSAAWEMLYELIQIKFVKLTVNVCKKYVCLENDKFHI